MSIEQYIGKPYIGDALTFARLLPDESVNCVVTSPPYYGLRDYGVDGQVGLEDTPQQYVERLVSIFREVRRVLRKDGTCWLNLGDSWTGGGSYAPDAPSNQNGGSLSSRSVGQAGGRTSGAVRLVEGLPAKNLLMIPARVAIALQDDGWYLRDEIVWHKPNPMPASVTDRTTRAHEMVYLLTKAPRYWYDAAAIAEPSTYAGKVVTLGEKSLSKGQAKGANVAASGNGNASAVTVNDTRNRRSVWTVPTLPTSEAHFATFPPDLIRPMILAGCPEGGIVYDPFLGSGTTAFVAETLGRRWIGNELNPDYLPIILKRLEKHGGAMEWLPLFKEQAT